MTDPQHEETFADTERKLREIITTLRAQLAEAQRLMRLERTIADKNADRADRAEAALAAQIEVDAAICTDIMGYDCMKADGETYQPMWVQKVARGMVSLARQDIRNQPQDRTALDRHDAKTREKALREAADEADELADEVDRGHDYGERASARILALIEVKP